MTDRIFVIVNPAAGGGRCGQRAESALARMSAAGLSLDIRKTTKSGQASEMVRAALQSGYRRFLAVGGDGTAFEAVNGLFPNPDPKDRAGLALLPLGTGNSFLKDFEYRGLEQTTEALLNRRVKPVDVIRLAHDAGELYFINLLTLGFAADVAALVNRRFKWLGEAGYILGVLVCIANLRGQTFPLNVDGEMQVNSEPCLFLAFSNSRCTGGKMMIAPHANPTDGLIEFVRWGSIGRLGLLRNLPRLFDGSHIRHARASRRAVQRVDFRLANAVNVTLDGESMRLRCRRIEILPAALDVIL
jgi:diacylglycerol kinase (ATP)